MEKNVPPKKMKVDRASGKTAIFARAPSEEEQVKDVRHAVCYMSADSVVKEPSPSKPGHVKKVYRKKKGLLRDLLFVINNLGHFFYFIDYIFYTAK